MARPSAEPQEVKGHVLRERAEAPPKSSYATIVGRSRKMQDLFHLLDKVTDSDVPVLIQGESGTGKELVARAIHFHGARKDGPFVSENCAAIPETLLESELFGYIRGAFTGAAADKKGLFEAANGGTLLLDEIGDMPLEMQKKLLRAIETREVMRVGAVRPQPIDLRFIAATHRDLAAAGSTFRRDLFYRLTALSRWRPTRSAKNSFVVSSVAIPEGTRSSEPVRGEGRLETYTIVCDPTGSPLRGIALGRDAEGRRFVANTSSDRALFEAWTREEPIGCRGSLETRDGLNHFTPR